MDWSLVRRRISKILGHPSPVRFVASRVLWHAGVSRLLLVRLPDGSRLRFFPSAISAALWADPSGRADDAGFLRSVLRPGDTYVDGGANVGHLAVISARMVGPTGRVVAIEANRRLFEYLLANIGLNGLADVRAVHAALGDAEGTAFISDRRDDDQNRVGTSGTPVRMTTLDQLVNDATVTVLKLDVEGFELPALRGADGLLARTKIVYCELSDSNCARFGYAPDDVEQYLAARGFVFAQVDGEVLRVRSPGVFRSLAAEEKPATGYNLVAVRRDFVPELARRLGVSHAVEA